MLTLKIKDDVEKIKERRGLGREGDRLRKVKEWGEGLRRVEEWGEEATRSGERRKG